MPDQITIPIENGAVVIPPMCTADNHDNKYRAIGYNRECAIAPEDFVSDQFTQNLDNPSIAGQCINDLSNDYKDMRMICQNVDPVIGNFALFVSFPYQLNRGGLADPYPEEIPQCGETQKMWRVLAKLEKIGLMTQKKYDMMAIPEVALPPPGWMDPDEELIDNVLASLRHADSAGLCQKRISVDPVRYALFFVGKTDKFGRAEDPANAYNAAEHFLTDPFMGAIPPEVLMGVLQRGNLSGLNDAQFTVLENLIGSGLNHGLSGNDLSDAAEKLSALHLDNDRFLYSFLTIISLRMGKLLNDGNSLNGGVSDDFDYFADAVENLIVTDAIKVHEKLSEDKIRYPAQRASYSYYNRKTKEISFKPFDAIELDGFSYGAIVHECYHAYQHLLALRQSRLEGEYEAYVIGDKLGALFRGLSGEVDPTLDDYVEARISNAKSVWESVTAYECPEDDIPCLEEVDRQLGIVYYEIEALWSEVMGAEAMGYPIDLALKEALFTQLRKLSIFRSAASYGAGYSAYNLDNYEYVNYALNAPVERSGN